VPGAVMLSPVITLDPNEDARVTFTGILQSAGTVTNTFVDVPGNPLGTYVVPKASQLGQQYFRARN
jgi:hypothetical protein